MKENKGPIETVNYLGKIVPRDSFRVFVYTDTNEKKLVESYEEYQQHLANGYHAEPVKQKRKYNKKNKDFVQDNIL